MKFIRVIALFMSAVALLSMFSACASSVEAEIDTSVTEAETEEEAMPSVEKNNYNDEFYLSILDDVNPPDYYWVEESEGDALSEAIYARQEKVMNYLGVSVISKMAGDYNNYIEPFKNTVINKDGSVDTLLSHVNQGVAGLISGIYLRSFDNLPGVDIEADHWNHEFMDTLSIAGKYYLGFSDFNILYTHVIAFDKKMLEKLSLDGYSEIELYDSVRNYEWTIDRLLELATLGYQEKSSGNIYGLTGQQWVPWIGFLHAADINLVEIAEDGTYQISIMNEKNKEKTADLTEKLKEFVRSKKGQFTTPDGNSVPSPDARLTNGRALMSLTSTYGLVDLLDYEISFGVLPYPMYDENQKDVGYRSLQWGGYLCVPSYLRNEDMTGETLEVLSFYSDKVKVTFYEKLLGKQVAEAPDDRQMLDLIWDGVCADFGQTFADEAAGLLYLFPNVTDPHKPYELVSYHASVMGSGNRNINAFVRKVEKASNRLNH